MDSFGAGGLGRGPSSRRSRWGFRVLACLLAGFLCLGAGRAAGAAGETSLEASLARAVAAWGQEVQAGRGSAEAVSLWAAGRGEEALAAARRDGDALGEALLRVEAGLQGDAQALAEAAGTLQGRAEPLLVAWVRFHAGLGFETLGRPGPAAAQLEAAVAGFRTHGAPGDLAEALKQLAGALLLAGRAGASVEAYQEASEVYRREGREVDRALTAGMRGLALAEAGRFREAVQAYRDSLPVLEREGKAVLYQAGRIDLGTVLTRQGRYPEAEAEIDPALAWFEAHGPRAMVPGAQLNRAALDLQRGRYGEARSRLEALLAGRLEPDQQRAVRFNLARVALEQGRRSEAERDLAALVEEARDGGAEAAEAAAWNALGSLYRREGRLARAEGAFSRARDLFRRLGRPADEAGALLNLGNVRTAQGRFREALELYDRAMAEYRGAGMDGGVAVALQDMSTALLRLGRLEEGLEALRQAEAMHEVLGRSGARAAVLYKLAIVDLRLGHRQRGLRYLEEAEEAFRREGMERALLDVEGLRALMEPDPAAREARIGALADRLEEMGLPRDAAIDRLAQARAVLDAGDPGRAAALYEEVLPALAEPSWALLELGLARAALGRLEAAEETFQQALRAGEAQGELEVVAWAAGALARLRLVQGSPAEAGAFAEQALRAAEEYQKQAYYAGGERLVVGQPPLARLHATAVRIQLALDRPVQALEALERGRGVLLEVTRLRNLSSETPGARELRDRLRAAEAAVLEARRALSEAPGAEKAALREEVERRAEVRDDLEAALGRATRTWEQQADPSAARLREALPPGTALLEFTFMEDGLHVFVVTRSRVEHVLLQAGPAPATPLDDLDPTRLEERIREVEGQVGVTRLVSQIQLARPGAADPEARRLWDLVMAPLEPFLGGVDRLLVVPDGSLHFLPLEALKDPAGRWLVERFSVSYLNTARELFLPPAPGGRGELVLGGPAYSLPGQEEKPREEVRRLGGPWLPLPGAWEEARAVGAVEGVTPLVEEAATEAAFRKALPGRKVLHLATHGAMAPVVSSPLQPLRPEEILMAFGLVMAGANGGGDGKEDGLLTAWEVLALDLQDADLVVLSACDTGRGVVTSSEGVFGLKRAFMVAGARRLVLSLWQVSDAATKALMIRFYRHMQVGEEPAEALRAARLELLRGDPVLRQEGLARDAGEFEAPYYWAPFILVGKPDGP